MISYLIDEGFAKSWEEAQDIMITLKPELVEEVYQSQLQKLEESKSCCCWWYARKCRW